MSADLLHADFIVPGSGGSGEGVNAEIQSWFSIWRCCRIAFLRTRAIQGLRTEAEEGGLLRALDGVHHVAVASCSHVVLAGSGRRLLQHVRDGLAMLCDE